MSYLVANPEERFVVTWLIYNLKQLLPIDAQADLSLRWTHSHFVGFVMSELIWYSIAIGPVTPCDSCVRFWL